MATATAPRTLPSLVVPVGSITPYVLVVGDPDRAKHFSERLEDARQVGRFREYHTYQGTWHGTSITITSHGVGGAGAAIAFEELAQGGANTVIRLGTCGSNLPNVRSGGLLIATAAVREDGVSERLAPLSYPAISDPDVTRALIDSARARPDVSFGAGVILTTGVFYPGAIPRSEIWRQLPIIGGEMEMAVLAIVGALRGLRVGGIFTVDGNDEAGADMTGYNPHREVVAQGKERMIEVALDAVTRLVAADEATGNHANANTATRNDTRGEA
jgi:uridine phosphorylase